MDFQEREEKEKRGEEFFKAIRKGDDEEGERDD